MSPKKESSCDVTLESVLTDYMERYNFDIWQAFMDGDKDFLDKHPEQTVSGSL